MKRLYLAHPVTLYGTPAKTALVQGLTACGWDVVDPEGPEHGAAYRERGMSYFTDMVATCDALGYLPFEDGSVGAGVAREILEALVRGLPVYYLMSAFGMGGRLIIEFPRVCQMPGPILTIDQTRSAVAQHRAKMKAKRPSAVFAPFHPIQDDDPIRGGDGEVEDCLVHAVAALRGEGRRS